MFSCVKMSKFIIFWSLILLQCLARKGFAKTKAWTPLTIWVATSLTLLTFTLRIDLILQSSWTTPISQCPRKVHNGINLSLPGGIPRKNIAFQRIVASKIIVPIILTSLSLKFLQQYHQKAVHLEVASAAQSVMLYSGMQSKSLHLIGMILLVLMSRQDVLQEEKALE